MLLFFMMLVIPTQFTMFKIILLIIVLTAFALKNILNKNDFMINKMILNWTLVLTIVGGLYVIYGLFNGNPGALNMATIHVVYPWLFLALIHLVDTRTIIESIYKIIIYFTLIISLYGLFYVLSTMGVLNIPFFDEIRVGQNISIVGSDISFSYPSLGTLMFTLPFVFSLLCFGVFSGSRRTFTWVVFILGAMVVFLSGRRALLLTVMLAPFVLLVFSIFLKNKYTKIIIKNIIVTFGIVIGISLGAILFLNFYLDFNFSIFLDSFLQGFNFSQADFYSDAYLRKLQFEVLLSEWMNRPFVGHGLGAASNQIVRSYIYPWSYELQYVSYLYNLGLIGMLIFGSSIAWVIVKGLQIAIKNADSSNIILPVLTGLTCFLFANATNPYLSKFDFMWTLFLPIAIINYYLNLNEAKFKEETS